MPLIAALYRGGGAQFGELAATMNASRDTLAATLTGLVDAGAVRRNTFFGQPVRREYVLTERGQRLGPPCIRAVEVVSASELVALALKKWPMLVLVVIARGATHFGEIRSALPGISARALALALKDLEDAGLVERLVAESYPPSVTYRLAPGAERAPLLDAMEALVAMAESA